MTRTLTMITPVYRPLAEHLTAAYDSLITQGMPPDWRWEWIVQDDVLGPGVLGRDISVLAENPSIAWTTSRVLDLLPDGSTAGFDGDPPPGPLSPGFVVNDWIEHNYRLPVHPTSICIRRDLAVALGGWMAVPGSDDTGLLTAASVVSTGYFHSEVGLLYRKWPGQATADPAHTEPVEWGLRMSLIRSRAELLAKTSPNPA